MSRRKLTCKNCGELPESCQIVPKLYRNVVSRPGPGTKEILCGTCIGNGYLSKQKLDEVWGELITDLKTIDTKLKSIRKRLKLTQDDLAEVLGVTRNMITMVERGQKAMPKTWSELIRGYVFKQYGLSSQIQKNVT
jgi:hypothetical protein